MNKSLDFKIEFKLLFTALRRKYKMNSSMKNHDHEIMINSNNLWVDQVVRLRILDNIIDS